MAANPKPLKVYPWASADNADCVVPPIGYVELGWIRNTTPPAEFMNEMMGGDFGTARWLEYLQTFEQQALTWPERQTYQKGLAASGQRSTVEGLDVTSGLTADKLTPAAGTGVLGAPLIDYPLPSGHYLTARHVVNASPLRYGRAYVTPTGFEFSLNAGWDTVNARWVADSTASPAILIRLTGSSIRVCRVDAPSATFLDSAFTEVIVADSTAGGRGKALGYAADGLATFSNAIRGAGVAAGSATFPRATANLWTTANALAWADVTGAGNLSGAINTTNNAAVQGGDRTIATLPAALAPASGAEAYGVGLYVPVGGTAAPVRVDLDSSGTLYVKSIPANALTGAATVLLPCLRWRLQSA